ncbi:hypothetical protein [Fusobacterium nucleatum]|jgi:hypothetical protein|uniref:hypothetical protein n=1 Tax=Fusobacterium nucleatum TaxID=851 RepID=UPI00201A4A48|nr:hypothetical protein [Fusobacterium nucleatum]MCL4591395.1 hypothetical protein [Fusobacterium nucleatum YWH7053]
MKRNIKKNLQKNKLKIIANTYIKNRIYLIKDIKKNLNGQYPPNLKSTKLLLQFLTCRIKIDRILRIKKTKRSRKKSKKLNILLKEDKKLGVLLFS